MNKQDTKYYKIEMKTNIDGIAEHSIFFYD